ncbi:MAG: hypothetical protein AB7V27_16840 [Candidatus Binatia bacterium]
MSNTALERLADLALPGTVRRGALPAEPVRRLPFGVGPLDALLDGGLPRGHLSEIVGGPASGRTAVLHALLAGATRAGEATAVVDLPDALDPNALSRAGADLARVLWVRPPSLPSALKCAELILAAGGFGLVVLDLDAGGLRARRAAAPAVWLRLAQTARRARTAAVIAAPERLANGVASLALTLTARRVRWSAGLLDGFTTAAAVTRSRFGSTERAVVVQLGEQSAAADDVQLERVAGGQRRRGEVRIRSARD